MTSDHYLIRALSSDGAGTCSSNLAVAWVVGVIT